jgi:hypothetical protein
MKGFLILLSLACALLIFLSGIGETTLVISSKSLGVAQASGTGRRVLEVVLPETAIVTLAQGSSYTGLLTGFNATELTLSAGNASRTVLLDEISAVEFQGDVWIPNEDGEVRRGRIRGLTQTLTGVPITALEIGSSTRLGNLALGAVLTQEEYERLSSDADRIHVLKELIFEGSDDMTIKIVGVRR